MSSHSLQASILTGLGVLAACATLASPPPPVTLVSAALPAQIRDILAATHVEVQGYRAEIGSERVMIVANRHAAAEAIVAVIDSVRRGETDPFTGQIRAVAAATFTDNQTLRVAIADTHQDIWEARAAAVGDIRTAIADDFDGSTVEEIGGIVATAHAAITTDRSVIATEASSNKAIRHSTATDIHDVVRSAADGDIDRDETSDEIHALVTDSHAEIKTNHVEMVAAHVDIKSTKKTATKDVHNAVKDSRKDTAKK